MLNHMMTEMRVMKMMTTKINQVMLSETVRTPLKPKFTLFLGLISDNTNSPVSS